MNINQQRGADLLLDAHFNKGETFTEEERQKYGLRGLLPTVPSSPEHQMARIREMLNTCQRPIDKALMLDSLHHSDEALFFRLLMEHTDEYMPIVYTPTVGEYCQRFSHIFRYPRGLFVSITDAGRVKELIDNVPNDRVDVIVVTDGQRILGLGDQGLNGMGIPIGKLSLYTACAGIDPKYTLPVLIDVGTNNEDYLKDPLYLGLRQERVTGQAYDALIEEFVTEARRRWPNVLIQFEDFGNHNAFNLLERYQEKILCFNDDIQGTAAVAVAGVYSAVRVKQQKLSDQKFLFLGAGEAATGIANLLVDALVDEGLSLEEARKHCMLFDSKGLIRAERENLAANKQPFAHAGLPECTTFIEAVRAVKPTGIIGVAAQPQAFNEEVIREMAQLNERPMIFALSNPTSRAECDAESAFKYTEGRVLFASGSPFNKVELNGKVYEPRQGNNSYVFPGLGLGAVFSQAKWMPNKMFLVAAKELATLVSEEDLAKGALYPPLANVRAVSKQIGKVVAEFAYAEGLAQNEKPSDLEAALEQFMYKPQL